MGIRKNYRSLTDDERERFVQALYHVKSTGLVDQLAQMHATHFFHTIHQSSHFLPWHREFILRFERALQEHDASITLPYWDSTVDRSPSDPLWNDGFLGQFDSAWDLGRELRSPPSLPTPEQVEVNQGAETYNNFWRGLEFVIHNPPHAWVGGTMGGLASPGDPVFFLHHCWIDLLWARWQLAHPDAPFVASEAGAGLNDPLMEWPDRTPADVLDHHALDYTYDIEIPPALSARSRTPINVVARFPEHLDVFAVAADGRTMSTWWDAAEGWAGWFHVSGGIASPGGAGSPVTAIARYTGHLDLFTVGLDNRVYSAYWDEASGWSGWFPIGTLVCRSGSTVNVVSRYSDHLDIFTTASDGGVMSAWWDASSGWSSWFQISGGVASEGASVTAIARYPFHLDVFTVGTDNRVYSCWWDESSGWSSWFAVGDQSCRPDSTVSVVARFPDQLDLFTTAPDGKIMSTYWNDSSGWGAWFQISGGIASAGSQVTAISRYSTHLDLFVIGTDNRIYSTWWDDAEGWASWFNVSGGVGQRGGQVAAISRMTEQIDLFTVGSDGKVMSTWWDASGGWGRWFTI